AIAIRLEPEQIRGYNDGSGGGGTYSITQPSTWYHLVMAWDNSTNKMYVNGKLVSSVSANTYSLDSLTRNQTIGAQYVYANYFNGTMDEVRIYSRALTDYEVWGHYSQGVSKYYDDFGTAASGKTYRYYGVEDSSTIIQPVTPNSTILHLRFNDNSTTNATDSSGLGSNGRTVGSAIWVTNSSCMPSFGGCMQFDGSTGYVKITNPLNTSSMTVATWVYPKSFTNFARVIDRWQQTTNADWLLSIVDSTGAVRFYSQWCNVLSGGLTGGALPANEWSFIAATWTPTSATVYINGASSATTTYPSCFLSSNTSFIEIGGAPDDVSGSYFNGAMDEVIIINRSLSADEINQLYLGGYNRTVNGRTHRIASADGVTTVAYNLTDHDDPTQQDYDQRLLLINGTQTSFSTFNVTGSVCSYAPTHMYATDYDSTEYSPSLISGLVYAGPASRFVRICGYNSGSSNTFNLTSLGETSLLIPFTQGNNVTVNNLIYQVETSGIPSTSFSQSLSAPGTVTISMMLEYQNIALVGPMKIGTGTYNICIKKTGIAAGRPVVSVGVC
ncbi:LamG domain-containing protein, partial [archaeon]